MGAHDPPFEDRIAVRGVATRELAPDWACWSVILIDRDINAVAAFDRCAGRAVELVEALRQATGPNGRVDTGTVHLQPRWDLQHEQLIGHVASAAVNAHAPVSQAGVVARAAVDAGADELHGPRLTITGLEQAREELLGEAVMQAQRKAQRIAAAAQRTLGAVVAVRELHPGHDEDFSEVAMAASTAPGPELPIQVADQTLTAAITATFALTD